MLAFGLQQHEQHGVGRQYGHNRESVAVLQHGGRHRARPAAAPNSSAAVMIAGTCAATSSGATIGDGLAVDQQPVAAEHDRGVDAVALADRGYEVADSGHVAPVGKWLRR